MIAPTSNLSRTIYDSRRFMWVAVISTMGATWKSRPVTIPC